jgi:hypothetical protein
MIYYVMSFDITLAKTNKKFLKLNNVFKLSILTLGMSILVELSNRRITYFLFITFVI